MKLTVIALLATILMASNSAAFTPTANDLAWVKQVGQGTEIIVSDMKLLSFVSGNFDLSGTKKYCDLMAEDTQTALENSQRYAVSTELQESKYYYEQALLTYNAGVNKISLGCFRGDATVISQGADLISKGGEYVLLATRALNTFVSTYAQESASIETKPYTNPSISYVGPTSAYAGAGQGAKVGLSGANLLAQT